MYLNLDPTFFPFGKDNAISFESKTFSGGEPHIRIHENLSSFKSVCVTHRIQSFNDMGLLLVAVDALKRLGVERIELLLPYFPGARQDRSMQPGESLTVKVYADIINHLGLERVMIFHPHSDVTPALLNNCKVMDNIEFIAEVLKRITANPLLISPDAGALKNTYKLAQTLDVCEVVECSKKRNVKTGVLTDFKVYSDDLKGRDCLIVDDICDGGGTFLGLAKALKDKNAGKLYLAVSHGIFSKGLVDLSNVFTEIFTTDAFSSVYDEGIELIELSHFLN